MKKRIVSLLVSTLFLTSARLTNADEIWITPAGPDNTGTGTAGSPYVCSSAASFDGLLPTIKTGSSIHLMAGTFATEGGVEIPAGCKLRGAGMDATTVRLLDNFQNFAGRFGGTDPVALGQDYPLLASQGNGTEASDFTIDCNLQNQNYSWSQGTNTWNGISIDAVHLAGSNVRLSRLKAINWGTTAPGVECFIFNEANLPGASSTNLLIEDCVITQPAEVLFQNGADGFCFGGNALDLSNPGSQGWLSNVEVRNCRCFNVGVGTFGNPAYFKGISLGHAVDGEKIDGNMFSNVGGDNIGTSCGSLINLSIDNNMLLNALVGIGFQASDWCGGTNASDYVSIKRNIRISNNLITVTSGGVALELTGFDGQPIQGLDIENNLVKAADGSGQIIALNLDYADALTVKNNTLDANGGPVFEATTNVVISQIAGNQNLAGLTLSPAGWSNTATIFGNYLLTNSLQLASSLNGDSAFLTYANIPGGNMNLGFSSSKNILGANNTVFGWLGLANAQANCGDNVAMGNFALQSTTNGCLNTAIGTYSMAYSLTGSHNVGVGVNTLPFCSASWNSAVGCFALDRQTTGWGNTALGFAAMQWVTNGSENVSLGYSSGTFNYSGSGNVVLGADSGQLFNSSYNILLGCGVEVPQPDIGGQMNIGGVIFGKGLKPTDTDNALAYAGNIGLFTTNLSNANFTVNGTTLLTGNVTVGGTLSIGSTQVTPFGLGLLGSTNPSSILTTLGLPGNPQTVLTVANLRNYAFTNNIPIISPGNVGGGYAYLSFTNMSGGTPNLGISSSQDILGGNNTVFGWPGLVNAQSNCGVNVAIGNFALQSLTNGSLNTAIGVSSLANNLSGSQNVGVGVNTLPFSTTSWNTAVGCFALDRQTTGWGNTALGFAAMQWVTNGSENLALGYSSGTFNHSGSGNVVLGADSGQLFNSSYNILLGCGVEVPLPDIGGQMNIGGVIFGKGLKPNDADNALAYSGNIGLFTTNLSGANFTVNGTTLLSGNVTVGGNVTAAQFSGNGSGLTNLALPTHPLLFAVLTNNLSISNNIDQRIWFNNSLSSSGINYSTNSGIAITNSGIYQVNVTVAWQNVTSSQACILSLVRNGVDYLRVEINPSQNTSQTLSSAIPLSAGDTVDFRVWQNGGSVVQIAGNPTPAYQSYLSFLQIQ